MIQKQILSYTREVDAIFSKIKSRKALFSKQVPTLIINGPTNNGRG